MKIEQIKHQQQQLRPRRQRRWTNNGWGDEQIGRRKKKKEENGTHKQWSISLSLFRFVQSFTCSSPSLVLSVQHVHSINCSKMNDRPQNEAAPTYLHILERNIMRDYFYWNHDLHSPDALHINYNYCVVALMPPPPFSLLPQNNTIVLFRFYRLRFR